MPKPLIVKVQVPLSTNMPGNPVALVYNEDRSIDLTSLIDNELKKKMRSAYKLYFFAEHVGEELRLLEEAPPQEW